MNRLIKNFTLFIMAIVFSFGFIACTPYPYNTFEYSDEYFEYHVLEPKKIGGYGKTKCYIVGLTEKGKEQTHLVVPEYYGNYQINGIGYKGHTYFMDTGCYGNFESEKLEKLYINFKVAAWSGQQHEVYNLPDTYIVYWNGRPDHYLSKIKGRIIGYNHYLTCHYPSINHLYTPKIIANVSYLYNYDGAENDGYYWVDSYEESIIDFIPPEPKREGYTFDGWYKESECANEWDFETDITGKEIVMEVNKVYDVYDGIYLYAKWIEN